MAGDNGSGALHDLPAIRAALRAARSGQDKLDVLLSAPDPLALVQALPEQDLYLTLLEIGLDDTRELISLSTPAQFTHCLDMACWPGRGDTGPDARRLLRWLDLARSTVMHSEEALARYRDKLASLDSELLALLLGRELIVHELSEDEPDPDVQNPGSTFRTPEGHYLLEFKGGDSSYAQVKALLDDLYAQDVLGTTRMLESLRWDLPTELDEIARRWRTGRLRDHGIPELDEALSFYARPARKPGPPAAAVLAFGGEAAQALVAPAAPSQSATLLQRALSQLDGDDLARAEEGIVYAANAAVVASGADLDDLRALREAVSDARATLSLGLELLSGGEEAQAARLLAQRPVKEIFQAAMGEAYRLQTRAREVQKLARLPQAQSVTLLDAPLSDVVDSLAAQRPRLADDSGNRRRARPLGSRSDLARASALLDEAIAVVQILDALGIGAVALGAKAEEAGLGPATLRASDALRSLASSQLRNEAFSLRDLPDLQSPSHEALGQTLDALLQNGTASVHSEAAVRAAARLRAQLKSR